MQISKALSIPTARINNRRVLDNLKDTKTMCLKVSSKICDTVEGLTSTNHVSFIRIIPSAPDTIKTYSKSLYKSMGHTYIPLLLTLNKKIHHPVITKNTKLDDIVFSDVNKMYYVMELSSPITNLQTGQPNKNIKFASNRKLHSVLNRILDIVHSSRGSVFKTSFGITSYKNEMLDLVETTFNSRTLTSYTLASELVNSSVSSWKKVVRRGMRNLFKNESCCDVLSINSADFVKDIYYSIIKVKYNENGDGCKISSKVIKGSELDKGFSRLGPFTNVYQTFLVGDGYTKPEKAEEVAKSCLKDLLKNIKRQSDKRKSANDFFEGMVLRTKNKLVDTIAALPEMIFDLKTPFVSKGWLVIAQCKNTGNIVAFRPKVLMLVASFENITVLDTIKISNKLHNHLAIYNVALNAMSKYAFGSKVVNASASYAIQLVKNTTHETKYTGLGKMRKIRRQNLCESILSSFPVDDKSEVDGLKDVLKLGDAIRVINTAATEELTESSPMEEEVLVESIIPSQEFLFSPPKPSKISYPQPAMSLTDTMERLVDREEKRTKVEESIVQLTKALELAEASLKSYENDVTIQTNFYQLREHELPSDAELDVLLTYESKKLLKELKRYDLDTKISGKIIYTYNSTCRQYIQTIVFRFV